MLSWSRDDSVGGEFRWCGDGENGMRWSMSKVCALWFLWMGALWAAEPPVFPQPSRRAREPWWRGRRVTCSLMSSQRQAWPQGGLPWSLASPSRRTSLPVVRDGAEPSYRAPWPVASSVPSKRVPRAPAAAPACRSCRSSRPRAPRVRARASGTRSALARRPASGRSAP